MNVFVVIYSQQGMKIVPEISSIVSPAIGNPTPIRSAVSRNIIFYGNFHLCAKP
jgi:hypothetical protein